MVNYGINKRYLKMDSSTICSKKCCGITLFHGGCCSIDDRDYIIGPIKDFDIFLEKLTHKIGRKISKDEVFIEYEEGKNLADSYNALYFEVSSKASIGLDKLVIEPATQLLRLYEQKVFAASDANGFKVINDKIKKISLEETKIKKCCTIQ